MTDLPPAEGTPEALRLRRAVTRRLHVVDALTPPPAPDFAARAIAAAREVTAPAEVEAESAAEVAAAEAAAPLPAPSEPSPPVPRQAGASTVMPLHRRRWPRLLVGVAAAVAIGAVAVPTLPHLMGGRDHSSAGSSAQAPEDSAVTGAATEGAPRGPSAVSGGGQPGLRVPFASGVATGPSGSAGDLTSVVERLRARLTAAPYDAVSVVLRSDPTRVEITLRAPDPGALEVAQGILPGGTRVVLLTVG